MKPSTEAWRMAPSSDPSIGGTSRRVRSCSSHSSPRPWISSLTKGFAKTVDRRWGMRTPIVPLRRMESVRAAGCGV